jgi:urease accessory protein
MNAPTPAPTTASGWHARLDLAFTEQASTSSVRTALSHRLHSGPLTLQRPFYPDPDGTCHVYLLHPPGGIAGGDTLELTASLSPRTRALLTTPAATKLYRADSASSRVQQTLSVADGAFLRWLPQETIAFSGADARLETRILLQGPTSRAIAWEVLCLGRPACDERFSRGSLRTSFHVERDEQPLFIERARYEGDGAMLEAACALNGQPVVGTLIYAPAIGEDVSSVVDAVRAALEHELPALAPCVAVSQLHAVIVCRYLGARTEDAQNALRCALAVITQHALGAPREMPRIWFT